jgi:hypothetical protein
MSRVRRSLGLLAMAAGLSVSFVATASAQDRCTAYANEMVSLDQRARQMKCPLWKSHSNWNAHFDWCQKQSDARAKDALDTWSAKFDGCATSFGGQGGGYQPPKPKAAGDQSRKPICSSFARYGVDWRNRAFAKGCNVGVLPDPMLSWSEGELLDWCMRTSDAEFRGRSPKALGYKAQIEKQCSQQLRRPFKL